MILKALLFLVLITGTYYGMQNEKKVSFTEPKDIVSNATNQPRGAPGASDVPSNFTGPITINTKKQSEPEARAAFLKRYNH